MRPSQILRLQSDWTAWQVDEACALVGLQMEADAMQGKTESRMQNAGGGRFASAKARVTKKIRIPKSGIF